MSCRILMFMFILECTTLYYKGLYVSVVFRGPTRQIQSSTVASEAAISTLDIRLRSADHPAARPVPHADLN